MANFNKAKEHLVPVGILDLAERYVKTQNQNEVPILEDRLETIRDYCAYMLTKRKSNAKT